MPINVARYRNLKHYKYQLVSDYVIAIDIKPRDNVRTQFIDLDTQGALTIKNGYAWDGPSGLGIDTRSFMRASLVHDALYQLMRAEYLDYRIQQRPADDFLRVLCVEDGMWKPRACSLIKDFVNAAGLRKFAMHLFLMPGNCFQLFKGCK